MLFYLAANITRTALFLTGCLLALLAIACALMWAFAVEAMKPAAPAGRR